ncbi:hypothetical protein DV737_g5339, partial [Chaetothyriales sp. CBS 132003]
MEEEYLPFAHQDSPSGANGKAALSAGKRGQGLAISLPDESLIRPQGHWQRNNSIAEGETLSLEPRRYAGANHTHPSGETPRSAAPAPSPGSAVTSLMHRMMTLRSPITKTKFRTVRRQHGGHYATLGDGADGEQYPVDLSSLAGLGYELHDMTAPSYASSSSRPLDNERTEYVGSQPEPNKPSFQSFVNNQKAVGSGLLNSIGAKIIPAVGEIPSQRRSFRSASEDEFKRSKTVRDIGQNQARETNQIVVVDNAVDLSSLEGAFPVSDRASRTFSGMSLGEGGQQGTLSYFFPDDPDVPNWKPFSLKSWYILILMILAFALAALQEALFQVSAKKHHVGGGGGLLSFNSVSDVAIGPFFAWKYLPTMITIVYAVLFSIMDFDIRRLEPFYQLSQPSGARASASLNLDHLTMFQYFIPFKALQLRQWAVFLSSIGNIVSSMAAPALQNPALQFGTNAHCENHNPDKQALKCDHLHEEQFFVYVPSVWSRGVTAAYIVVGLILVVLLLIQLRRKSGLLSDPKGIAGLASMATKSHILRDFKGLDQADHVTIHKRLAHRRFVLYKSSLWQGELQVESDDLQGSEDKLKSPHPMMLRKRYGAPFIGFMIFGLFTIPLISLSPARVVPNTVPWLPVLLATLLKLLFATFESDVRLMEPFYILSKGNAPPHRCLTLDYQATVYGWMPIKALMNGHLLVALVGLASVMLDILTVTVGSFSVDSVNFLHHTARQPSGEERSSQDETFVSFWVSLVLSVSILAFVIAVTVLVYVRRSHPFLPREPSTIASVLAFIYASNMLTDFIDTERLNSRQMEKRLRDLGKRYGLGWFRGRDGEIHCAIDEEPMKSRYVHGKPYTKAQAGPAWADEPSYYVAGYSSSSAAAAAV